MASRVLSMSAVFCALVSALVLVPNNAVAQQFVIANGVCEKFIIGRDPATRECTGKLVNTVYDNGRLGFYFTFRRGSVITFSGISRPNPTPDTALFSIDQIIMSVDGAQRSFAATGSCRYGNFYAGHRRVTCKGQSDDGQPFEAIFRMTSAPEPI